MDSGQQVRLKKLQKVHKGCLLTSREGIYSRLYVHISELERYQQLARREEMMKTKLWQGQRKFCNDEVLYVSSRQLESWYQVLSNCSPVMTCRRTKGPDHPPNHPPESELAGNNELVFSLQRLGNSWLPNHITLIVLL